MRIVRIAIASVLAFGTLHSVSQAAAKPPTPEPATISSDDLDIRDHGAKTVFTGHVVLKQFPYKITSDRMVQVRATGMVTASRNVHGYWVSDKGERVEAVGDQAQYDSKAQTMVLTGHALVTRWSIDPKALPQTVSATRIVTFRNESQVVAVVDVVMAQGTALVARAPEARYDETKGLLDLDGGRVYVHVEGDKGKADFEGDRGWVTMDPKHAQLIDHVKGHIIPAP